MVNGIDGDGLGLGEPDDDELAEGDREALGLNDALGLPEALADDDGLSEDEGEMPVADNNSTPKPSTALETLNVISTVVSLSALNSVEDIITPPLL